MKKLRVQNEFGEPGHNSPDAHDVDPLLSIIEVAKTLGVCSRSVRRGVDRKELPQPVKVGNAVRFFKSEVLAYL